MDVIFLAVRQADVFVAMATRASVDAEGGSPIDGIPSRCGRSQATRPW